jgi:hypothetical protein
MAAQRVAADEQRVLSLIPAIGIPVMVIRDANSDMLARSTLNEMVARRGQLEVVVVPDQGHAPLLAELKVVRRVAAFVHLATRVCGTDGPLPGRTACVSHKRDRSGQVGQRAARS